MFKKIKDILGIEGVKLELISPEEISFDSAFVEGIIRITSKSKKTVTSLTIKLIEKYQRGRKENILINEYLLSSLDIEVNLEVDTDQPEELKFKLPLNMLMSDMDKFGNKNPLTKGLASVAKKLKGVQSYYRIEAIATVKESSFEAITKRPISIV